MNDKTGGLALPENLRAALDRRAAVDPFATPISDRIEATHINPANASNPTGPALTPLERILIGNDAMAPCACDQHPCANLSTQPLKRVQGHTMEKRARCQDCINQGHSAGKPAPGNPKFTTGVLKRTKTPLEIQRDREASTYTRTLQIEKHTEHWFKSLDARFRDADLANSKIDDLEPEAKKQFMNLHDVIEDRLDRLRSYLDNPDVVPPYGFLLAGATDSGKTWFSYALLNAAIREGLLKPGEIVHGNERDLMAEMVLDPFGAGKGKLSSYLRSDRRVLFIDDIGQGGGLAVTTRQETLFALFNHFSAHGRFIIATTNLSTHSIKTPATSTSPATSTISDFANYLGGDTITTRLSKSIGHGVAKQGVLVLPSRGMRFRVEQDREAAWQAQRATTQSAPR